ncbi:MAG: hypothetical protein KAH07_01100 [Flavobacteriaceae bacterium]|nr:hypothetical protein [Flavobacteriaceae bacterium]
MENPYSKIKSILPRIFNSKNSDSDSDSYSYSSKRYYQSTLIKKYDDGKFYISLIKKIKNKNEIKTNVDIQLLGAKKLNEIDVKSVVRRYGKPNSKFVFKNLLGIEVLIFKRKIGAYKYHLEFHFFNNNLFFYTYIFLDFNKEKDITEMIKEKYIDETNQLYDKKNNFIIDKNNNIILLNDNIPFSVYYLCDNKIVLDKITKHLDLTKTNIKNKHTKHKKTLYNEL